MKIDEAEIFVERLPGNGNLNFVLIHNAGEIIVFLLTNL